MSVSTQYLFSLEYRQVLAAARADAFRAGAGHVGAGHLLAGTLATPACSGAEILRRLGAHDLLAAHPGPAELDPASDALAEVPYDRAAKRALEQSMQVAGAGGLREVHTGHLLLALAELPPGFSGRRPEVARVLGRAGVTPARLREAMSLPSGDGAG